MISMFINYGEGKCPLCGDFGKAVEKEIFHCTKCRTSFNNFFFIDSSVEEVNKYWN